jgi:hypothetical protein
VLEPVLWRSTSVRSAPEHLHLPEPYCRAQGTQWDSGLPNLFHTPVTQLYVPKWPVSMYVSNGTFQIKCPQIPTASSYKLTDHQSLTTNILQQNFYKAQFPIAWILSPMFVCSTFLVSLCTLLNFTCQLIMSATTTKCQIFAILVSVNVWAILHTHTHTHIYIYIVCVYI